MQQVRVEAGTVLQRYCCYSDGLLKITGKVKIFLFQLHCVALLIPLLSNALLQFPSVADLLMQKESRRSQCILWLQGTAAGSASNNESRWQSIMSDVQLPMQELALLYFCQPGVYNIEVISFYIYKSTTALLGYQVVWNGNKMTSESVAFYKDRNISLKVII